MEGRSPEWASVRESGRGPGSMMMTTTTRRGRNRGHSENRGLCGGQNIVVGDTVLSRGTTNDHEAAAHSASALPIASDLFWYSRFARAITASSSASTSRTGTTWAACSARAGRPFRLFNQAGSYPSSDSATQLSSYSSEAASPLNLRSMTGIDGPVRSIWGLSSLLS